MRDVTDGVAAATDQQASSTEAVVSLVDQTVASAKRIATDTGVIATELESEAGHIETIDRTLEQFVDDADFTPDAGRTR